MAWGPACGRIFAGRGCKVVAFADPDESLCQQLAVKHSAAAHVDLRKVLDDPNVDAVVIATCNHWHCLATIWALDAGKDGYVERGRKQALLCLAYRMTGDRRFGDRIKQSLFSHEFGGRKSSMLMKRDPPWHAGLDTGEKCASFAIAYDTVHDLLLPEERQALAARFAQEGILPVLNDWVLGGRRIRTLDTMGHNWWYFGSKFPGTVSQLIDAGELRYVLADATGPTSDHFILNFRSFLWLGDVILVIDDFKTFGPANSSGCSIMPERENAMDSISMSRLVTPR